MNSLFTKGIKDGMAAALGVIPLGVSVGILAMDAGMSVFESIALAAMNFAGSASLMAIGMLNEGSPIYLIIIATFFINLRNFILSGSAFAKIKNAPLGFKLACAFGVCDLSVPLFVLSREDSEKYFFGINTVIYSFYVLATVMGILMRGFMPQTLLDSFGIALYAMFLGTIIPKLRGNRGLVLMVLLTMALSWFFRFFLSTAWAIIFAMAISAAAGVFFVDLGETGAK